MALGLSSFLAAKNTVIAFATAAMIEAAKSHLSLVVIVVVFFIVIVINNPVFAMIVHNVQDKHLIGIGDRENQAIGVLDSYRIDALGLLFELMEARKTMEFLNLHALDSINQLSNRLCQAPILLPESTAIGQPTHRLFVSELNVHFV